MVTILNYTTVLWSQLQVRSQVATDQAAWDRLRVPSQRTGEVRGNIATLDIAVTKDQFRWRWHNYRTNKLVASMQGKKVVIHIKSMNEHVRCQSSAKLPSSCHWQTTLGLTGLLRRQKFAEQKSSEGRHLHWTSVTDVCSTLGTVGLTEQNSSQIILLANFATRA